MPDLERRSSASFISSNEGGTPVSFRRSWMNRKSSLCFLVSILRLSLALRLGRCSIDYRESPYTNHERNIDVRAWFRKLILSEAGLEAGGIFCKQRGGARSVHKTGIRLNRKSHAPLTHEIS